MNSPKDDGQPAGIDEVRSRIQELREAFESRTRRSERKFKLYIVAGIALPVALSISLTVLTNMAFQLDAQALTQIGRHEVEKNLPVGRESMVALLKERAPEITSQIIAGLMGSISDVRPLVMKEMDHRFLTVSADFEEQLLGLIKASIVKSKLDLDKKYPGMTDADKIDELVTATAGQFNQRVETVLDGLYPKYAEEMERVEAYLAKLRDTESSQLTSRERSQKEIIVTLLRLVSMETQSHPAK